MSGLQIGNGKISFDLANSTEWGTTNLVVQDGSTYQCYYLHWYNNTGLYLDLPVHPEKNRNTFLTADLTGCCVGVQCIGTDIRVRHFNMFGQSRRFSEAELCRGPNCYWLLPAGKGYNENMNNRTFYNLSNTNAAFWGEYDGLQSKWNFYFQNGTNDTTVYEFAYHEN